MIICTKKQCFLKFNRVKKMMNGYEIEIILKSRFESQRPSFELKFNLNL